LLILQGMKRVPLLKSLRPTDFQTKIACRSLSLRQCSNFRIAPHQSELHLTQQLSPPEPRFNPGRQRF